MTPEGLYVSVLGTPGTRVFVPDGAEPLVIGRGRDCGLRLEDPLVSRRHALVHGGHPPRFEMLGAKNPSALLRAGRTVPIAPDQPVELTSGDLIKLGAQLIAIDHGGVAYTACTTVRGELEAQLGALCAASAPIALIRVQLSPSMRRELAQSALYTLLGGVEGVAASLLGAFDLTLVVRADDEHLARELDHLASQLGELEVHGDVGVARYPEDGATAAELLVAASAAVETLRAGVPVTGTARPVAPGSPFTPLATTAVRPREGALVIAAGARTILLPSGDRVDLARHAALRRIVLALASRRRDGIATGLTTDELLACGWPGERVDPFAGSARVRVALSRLRTLGLRDLLVRADDGYVLAPHLAVEIEPA